jgi:outer membrane protein assembly factor BamA
MKFYLFIACISWFYSSVFATELLIHSVRFDGNYVFSSQQLSKAIYSQQGQTFQQKVALEDAQRLADYYEKNGFFQTKILTPLIQITESGKIEVIFQIEEGNKASIDSILLTGNQYITTETVLANLSHKLLMDVPLILQTIVDYYTGQGFLFAKTSVDSVFYHDEKLILQINIEEGHYCRFEKFVFRGNNVTKESTLLQITQLNRQKTISPQVLNMATENLRKKPYISQAEIIPLNYTTALIEIKENNMTFFSAMLGYDNREKQNKRLNGFFNLEFLNLYGTDRALTFHWQKLTNARTTIELSYHESGIRQIPIGGDFTILREEVDSTYIATDFQTELYWFTIFMKYGIYYSYEDIYPGRIKIIDKTNFQRIGFFGRFQNVDYALNPRRGNDFFFRYYTIFSQVDKQKVNKQALESYYLHFLALSMRMVISGKVSMRLLENKSVTQFEYFYLGGHADLRGFMEEQFYGFRTGLVNLELRYLIGRDSRIFLFTDYGYVENSDYRYGKLFGFGFGLRVSTRLGLVGMDYGFGYQETLRNPLEGIVHFGIETRL